MAFRPRARLFCSLGMPVKTQPATCHVGDDALELYALGRDTRACDSVAIEEHVHTWQRCRKRLQAEREYVQVVRAALRAMAAPGPSARRD
jgi:hypothetical protein